MKPLMIIIPDPENDPTLCIMVEKESFKMDEDGNVTINGREDSRVYSVEGAIKICNQVNNKLKEI